jgi:hypothetical protein
MIKISTKITSKVLWIKNKFIHLIKISSKQCLKYYQDDNIKSK